MLESQKSLSRSVVRIFYGGTRGDRGRLVVMNHSPELDQFTLHPFATTMNVSVGPPGTRFLQITDR